MCVYVRFIRLGYFFYMVVGNSLFDMYAKCGMIEFLERCFVEIRNKDMGLWNIMLFVYVVNGLVSFVVLFFLLM